MKCAVTCVLFLLGAQFAYGQQPAEATGSICGLVSNENGEPASHVHVVAIRWSPGGYNGGLPGSETDGAGHYCVSHLRLGDYEMSAYDEKKGYPIRLMSGFYTWDSPAPRVTLTPYNPEAHLDWRIPFKAGFLRLHATLDRSDVRTVSISIRLVVPSRPKIGIRGADWSLRTGQTDLLTVLVPPGEDVLITATSPGYRLWPDDRGELINLSSGETKDVTISLTAKTP